MTNGDDSIKNSVKNHNLKGTEKGLDFKKSFLVYADDVEADRGLGITGGTPYGKNDPSDNEIYQGGLVKAAYEYARATASGVAIQGDVFGGENHGEFRPNEVTVYTTFNGNEPSLEFKVEWLKARTDDEGPRNASAYDDEEGKNRLFKIDVGDEVLKYSYQGNGLKNEQRSSILDVYKTRAAEQKSDDPEVSEGYCPVTVEEDSLEYVTSMGLFEFSKQIIEQIHGKKYGGEDLKSPVIHAKVTGDVVVGDKKRVRDRDVDIHVYCFPVEKEIERAEGEEPTKIMEYERVSLAVPQMWYNCFN